MIQYVFLSFLLYFSGCFASQLSVSINAESAILMNAETGAILFEKKPHAKLFPASLTKVATAAFILDQQGNDLDKMLTADQDCIGSVTEEAKQRANYTLPSYWLVTDSSHMGIKRGETLSMRDLLYGVLVASADDAANIVAKEAGGGSIPAFMDKLNVYIKEIGCKNTFFNNPHGLHHPKHITTAYDMGIITKHALKNSLFREMVRTLRYTRPKTNKQESTILLQTNRLLRSGEFHYPKAIGVKTGRTSKAGNTFVAAAVEGDRTLIAVLMNVKERKDIFRDAIRLFDAAFAQQKIEKKVIQSGFQKHSLEIEGADKLIRTYSLEDIALAYFPSEEPKMKAFLQWDQLRLPIKKGQKVGELQIKGENQEVLGVAALYAQEDVSSKWSFSVKEAFKGAGYKLFLIAAIITVILGAVYLVLRSSKL